MSEEPSYSASKKLLIVEDDLALADLLSKALASNNLETQVLYTGNEVIAKTQETFFDMILLDIDLPGKDGFTLLTELRQDPHYQFVPIILLTNHGELSQLKKGKEQGATDYLIKANVDYSKLKFLVDKYLTSI